MDRENLEILDEESLFKIQNIISEIIKERNFKKGDIETIVDKAFSVAFPKIDGLGLNPWWEGSVVYVQEQEWISPRRNIFVN